MLFCGAGDVAPAHSLRQGCEAMENVVATFFGTRLRIVLERLTPPSGVAVATLRLSGSVVTAERKTLTAAMAAAGGLDSEFTMVDASEADRVDHTGAGEILLLSGRMRAAGKRPGRDLAAATTTSPLTFSPAPPMSCRRNRLG